jgi:glucose/arabinose dehydrogenase
MRTATLGRAALLAGVALGAGLGAPRRGAVAGVDPGRLSEIRLPRGFRIDLFSNDVPNARSLCLSPGGTLFVGSRSAGAVYALVDRDRDGRSDRTYTIARGLREPNGVALKDGSLYVAEVHRVLRFDGVEQRLENPPAPSVVTDRLPRDGHHGWKFIRFGPDGRLYVPVGAPCNVCERPDPYAAILRMDATGPGWEVFARGVRNTVGFDWHPTTKELWFTDNGRDWMGDDRPPDELNHAPKAGLHFGFPYRHGKDVPDPEHARSAGDRSLVPPAIELGPHVAALGMRFYTGSSFPKDLHGQVFIAEHGSWNRSRAIGYRVTLVRLKEGRAASYETFAEGWLGSKGAWGRPVDVEVMPDGSLLVSDDLGGAIYRIRYVGAGT